MTTTTEKPAVASALETSDRVASHLHPEPSYEISDHPVPTGLEEVWRFTPLKRLRGLHADAVFQPSTTECSWTGPEQARIAPVSGADAAPWRGVSGYIPTDRLSARIFAETDASLSIDIPAEAELDEPVVVTLKGTSAETTEAGHVAIRFGAHSSGTVVLLHEGSATLGHVVEVEVADGARAVVVTVQDWADDAVHVAHHSARVGRDASLKHAAVSFGGDVVRLAVDVNYQGQGGSAELFGLYFADAGQHLEHRLFVDHNQPRTNSNVDYKGALQGDGAHSVWIGDVLIRKIAEGINTYESNKNLVLTDGARADSVPNLEIETGEIEGAGHASTTGRFDDEQLFYLQSRGVSEIEARRLVVYGFFADIVKKIGVSQIESRLMEAIEAELALHVGAASATEVDEI
ncbi:MAG TPA: Fe-S cluster assembly protein SufD [Candidatus Avipropionibacterium avicola]|uniref:Fe-S cluster assembly protein SufD n=1 Tax=Candidatus Avipropionibacterium avicola TaxID=2840701 RepID=A0A9D1GX99_9ACTN|nr:Fe-S cluster assembly protein SufD [Candidatus Avipropionibacterium avicola]